MKNEVVGFEVGRLAKEKGFDLDTNLRGYYKFKNDTYNRDYVLLWTDGVGERELFLCYAPTQSVLQKWLREKHLIFVSVNFESYRPDSPAYYAEVRSISTKDMGCRLLDGFTVYDSFEAALEEGLEEALKLIHNESN